MEASSDDKHKEETDVPGYVLACYFISIAKQT
jgi:hypothetical protein